MDASATVCPACGAPVESASQPASAPTMGATPMSRSERPVGVTIIAVLAGLLGLLVLIGSLALMAMSSLAVPMGVGFVGHATFGILGAIALVIALLSLAGAYGFWTGAKWGWWLGIIVSVLWIIEIVTFNVVGFLIGLIMLYYLTRPHIRAWFHEMHPL